MILRQTPHPTFSEWGSRGCDTGQQAPRGAAQRTWQESEGSVQAPRQLRALPAGHPHPRRSGRLDRARQGACPCGACSFTQQRFSEQGLSPTRGTWSHHGMPRYPRRQSCVPSVALVPDVPKGTKSRGLGSWSRQTCPREATWGRSKMNFQGPDRELPELPGGAGTQQGCREGTLQSLIHPRTKNAGPRTSEGGRGPGEKSPRCEGRLLLGHVVHAGGKRSSCSPSVRGLLSVDRHFPGLGDHQFDSRCQDNFLL